MIGNRRSEHLRRGRQPLARLLVIIPLAMTVLAISSSGNAVYAANPGTAGPCTGPYAGHRIVCDPPLSNPDNGPVEASPTVYVIFWGPDWPTPCLSPDSSEVAGQIEQYALNLLQPIGNTGLLSWYAILTQYGSGAPTFGGCWVDSNAPPDPVTENSAAPEIEAAMAANPTWTQTSVNSQFVIVPEQGSKVKFDTREEGKDFCAYHYWAKVGDKKKDPPLAAYDMDPVPSGKCAQFYGGPDANVPVAWQTGLSHEYTEAATDPFPKGAKVSWTDQSRKVSGEVADLCIAAGVSVGTGTYVQPLWSDKDTGVTTTLAAAATTGDTTITTNAPLTSPMVGSPKAYISVGGTGLDWVDSTGIIVGPPDTYRSDLSKPLTASYAAGTAVAVQGGCVTVGS